MMAQETENDTFKSLLENALSKINADELQKMRVRAWDHFIELGLPTRKTETYRYVKLRQLFAQPFHFDHGSHTVHSELIAPYVLPECVHSVLVFVNGCFIPSLSNIEALSSKIVITPLTQAYRPYGALLNNFWAKSLKQEIDSFATLNAAFHHSGLFVYMPPKTIEEVPLQILHIIQNENDHAMLTPRVNFFIGAESELTIISTQNSLNDSHYVVNQVTEIAMEEGAKVHYTQNLCKENPNSWHIDALRATLKRNSCLKTVSVNVGSSTIRNDYHITLAGEHAEAYLNGIWMLTDKKESHTNIFIDHQAPNCRSYQLFKGILKDYSRSSFEGKIMVRQAAQKTEAFQLNNNLTLDDHAQAYSKPNLEIFADDVKASHGATVGQLDADQLFYMRARGFTEQEAKNLLIHGFCEQVIDMIKLPSLRKDISTLIHS